MILSLIAKIYVSNYDLIFFDVGISSLDNFTALGDIIDYEKNNNLKQIPLIALSVNELDKNMFLKFDVKEYLKKPIDVNQLKKVFDKYLNNEEKEEKNELSSELKFSYNKQDAIDALCLDESIIDMLLENFFSTLENDLKNIQDAIDAKDSVAIAQKAHYLKGSCANLAMNDAALMLKEIELKAKDGEINFDLTILRSFFEQIK
jgi:CheY-like chemotaxis protein